MDQSVVDSLKRTTHGLSRLASFPHAAVPADVWFGPGTDPVCGRVSEGSVQLLGTPAGVGKASTPT